VVGCEALACEPALETQNAVRRFPGAGESVAEYVMLASVRHTCFDVEAPAMRAIHFSLAGPIFVLGRRIVLGTDVAKLMG